MKKKQGTANSLRLGRRSQLLTSEDYIKLLVESENKKMEIQELKQKKKKIKPRRRRQQGLLKHNVEHMKGLKEREQGKRRSNKKKSQDRKRKQGRLNKCLKGNKG